MIENLSYLDTFITGVAVLSAMTIWDKYIKRPIVWIIDDSITDQTILKVKLKGDAYDVRYFNNAKGIIEEYIKATLTLRGPKAVVVDYFLNDGIDGKQVIDFFTENDVKTILMTGYEGEISGIPSHKIIHKDSSLDHIQKIEDWIHAIV